LNARRPQRAPGLENYPACDEEVRSLANEIWGETSDQPVSRAVGKGKIVSGKALADVLRDEGIVPDCLSPWNTTHRRTDEAEIYFVTGGGQADCIFRVSGKAPELWDPMTGTIREAACYRQNQNGQTAVLLSLPKNGSIFVVFRKPADEVSVARTEGPDGGLQLEGRRGSVVQASLWKNGDYTLTTSHGKSKTVNEARLPEPKTLEGPWDVHFAPGWGAPESVVFDQLTPWNEHANPGIKYFSGKATYHATFMLSPEEAAGLARLNLGGVHYIGRVRLNGKDLGIVWTEPWTVELTGVAKPGENRLEIDVVNLWVNRLIGDAGLPKDQRRTNTNVVLETGKRTKKVFQAFGSTDPLMPSGLLGPVRLDFGRKVEVSLDDAR